jgi:hypothetical protein
MWHSSGIWESNQNPSQEVIKRRLKSGYLCYWADVMSVITSHVSTHCVCPQLTQHGLLRGADGMGRWSTLSCPSSLLGEKPLSEIGN